MSFNGDDWVECKFGYGDTVGKICSRYEITLKLFQRLNPQIANIDWVSVSFDLLT